MSEVPDEIERQLRSLTPRGAPAELRSRVVEAVTDALRRPSSPRRGTWLPWSVAAAVLLAAGLNVAVGLVAERRIARVYRRAAPPQVAIDVASAVASITNAETGRWFADYLSRSLPARRPSPQTWPADELRAIAEISNRG